MLPPGAVDWCAAADHVDTVSPTFFINSRYSLTYYVPPHVPVDMGFDLAGLGFSSAYINQIHQVHPLGLRLPVINAPLIVRAHTLRFGADGTEFGQSPVWPAGRRHVPSTLPLRIRSRRR